MNMYHALARRLRCFRRSEDATATLEFAIVFPFFISLFLSTVELGMITFQHSMLERGLDMAVRDVRLGTGTAPQHDEIKQRICTYAGVLQDCQNALRLEMIPVDLRNSVSIDPTPDCVDSSKDVTPVRHFVNGQENELMILRACYKFSPVFPTAGLGKQLEKDGAGQVAMIAMSAFVQEPD
ncbi:TadE/TadG family type IV pilus assembly protein [Aquicoccus sp. G2-2]|uniref:TadE/TadG family type IV pilus assembly protein n=1 Tax=Aquicoccus sp. G2-2 TaxID=3092120 RepID=UPI002AE0ABCD|nr:TadE/TadG family type IV pilus assembly protein [Aquicoccus sp. G2-2]MEA1113850.1 TadE/TadG family type IV pilus assembly protein [Aquicoccus sp. G2-2]